MQSFLKKLIQPTILVLLMINRKINYFGPNLTHPLK